MLRQISSLHLHVVVQRKCTHLRSSDVSLADNTRVLHASGAAGISPLIERSIRSVIVCESIQKRQLMRSAHASRDMRLVEQ